jgi:hypothetical protein
MSNEGVIMKDCNCLKPRNKKEKAFHDFMGAQIKQIMNDKWLDSEKAGHDLTNEGYVENWIICNAKKFREIWDKEHKENK